ncbi:MAG TPA: hypothetical protein VFY71_08365 [Planctomycetota bacterium]|nr:hypothetical protein [Planctomycetota bacterium]
MHEPCAAILALALLAVPAGAQLTGKQATAQLRAASKQTLKDAKAAFKDAHDAALEQIEAYEAALKADGFAQDDAVALLGELNAFVGALQVAERAACSDFALAMLDLLVQVDDFSVMQGEYPEDFQQGTGGVADELHAALAKEAEKASASVFKRLDKTAKLLEKEQDVLMTVVRRPLPPGLLDVAVNQGAVIAWADAPQLTIDLALTFSSSSVLGDGLAFLAGTGSEALTSVSASLQGLTHVVLPDAATDRWSTVFGDVTPLTESNLIADAMGAEGGSRDTLVIALR